ncbi:hypothetical protein RFI_08914 [Reticulomyxa filosa]|uniref:Viral A-type inclusion protein n=1 Tax=Reticulomyxa filosa TaxID=46433 RepID=X6NS99_RETFI|nr:hypothetical protein RFI_08914 [Reticulomyxa filosa]|eukprot:ETO28217.1 hypothetical protein RFI_08914 [Reticulomyxa filosa]
MLLFEAEANWVSPTNEPQKLIALICCLCNQIANNAMELHCDEHENADHIYLVGEECLQKYLKQNNGKCPIQRHDHCEFSQNKSLRKLVSELLVICPRQFDSKKGQSNEGKKLGVEEEEGCENESNSNAKSKIISLQNTVKDLQSQMQNCKLWKNDNEKDKQIEQLNVNNSILQNIFLIGLTNDIEKLKMWMNETIISLKKQNEQIEQMDIKFNARASESKEHKQIIKTNFENQNTNIQRLNAKIEEEKKGEQKEKDATKFKCNDNCENIVAILFFPSLRNRLYFLLVSENKQNTQLKNIEWNNYNVGIFLLGENITLTANSICGLNILLPKLIAHNWDIHRIKILERVKLEKVLLVGMGQNDGKMMRKWENVWRRDFAERNLF